MIPSAICVVVAMIIVKNNKVEKNLVNKPNIRCIPPKNSENAAINPQKVGKKFIPIDLIPNSPKLNHFSGPPMNLGQPCIMNIKPIPTLSINIAKFILYIYVLKQQIFN